MTIRDVWTYFFKDANIELYKFTVGEKNYCYAMADVGDNYQHEGLVYEPMYGLRSNLRETQSFAKDVLTVTLTANNAFAALFKDQRPEKTAYLTVYSGNFRTRNFLPVWSGRVLGAAFFYTGSTYSCELSCETPASLTERQGLTRRYQVTCPYNLYGNLCRANKNNHSYAVIVGNVFQNQVIVEPLPADANTFISGQMVAPDGSRRVITQIDGNTVYLERTLTITAGDAATMIMGCNKTLTTCKNRFNNNLNYGGFPNLPTTNAFTATIG